ncbi:MAG: radical SAM protein [Thermofilaceae archaeon]
MNFDVIITSDRTMMSNHHGKEFLGFIATGPPLGLPEHLWMWMCAPKPKVDKMGRPLEAPYGLRKIEASLINAGINAAVIDPDYLNRYLKHAKILMVGHHDFFAMCSPSIEWWLITGSEPLNSRSFKRFMRKPEIREAKKHGLKIIVGGPAAWQWLWRTDYWREFGVDTVVEGEADKVIVELANKVFNGEDLPLYVYVGPGDSPSLNEIPDIKGASVNGLIEITRGCPRKCRFCSVTLRPLRHYPLDKIEREIRVNVHAGLKNCIFHSEDVLMYGSIGIEPNLDLLIQLHKLAKKYCKIVTWSHATLALVKYSQEKYNLISRLTEILYDDNQEWIGVEVGIETGSSRLVGEIMPAKAAPYPVSKWPEVVRDAFAIMHEHKIVPAATLILGLPNEQEEDTTATLELLDELSGYRSIIVPMFFVPLGSLKDKAWFLRNHLTDQHVEILRKCLWHSIKWAEDILSNMYLKGVYYAPLKTLLKFFIAYVKKKGKEAEKTLVKLRHEEVAQPKFKNQLLPTLTPI